MQQPVYTFDYTTDDNVAAFGCVSGRTEKEAKSRLKRRYQLSETELATATLRECLDDKACT